MRALATWKTFIQLICFVALYILSLTSCKKQPPTVETNTVSQISISTALGGGNVTDDGGSEITSRGIVWAKTIDPSLDRTGIDYKLSGTGIGAFSETMANLSSQTTYYVRAFATNSEGTSYGESKFFKTETPNLPPSSPFDPNPAIGSINVALVPNLIWKCTDPENDPLLFDLYMGTSSSSVSIVSTNVNGLQFLQSGLLSGTKYYWKIIAKDNRGNTTEGQLWNFTTGIAPDAKFIANPIDISTGTSVTFTDQSTNSPSLWAWDFGDGATSVLQNPTHTYLTAGLYTVKLTASNSFGSDTEVKASLITVRLGAPVANFVADKTIINVGESVIFTDQSTNSPDKWSWSFGDGGTSSSNNPTHTFAIARTYTITLIASNATGQDTETKIDYITVKPIAPIANFAANQTSVVVGNAITFTDQSANSPTSWSWNFGDGTTSTDQNPIHIYNTAGTFTVSLTCANSSGSDVSIKTNYITIRLGAPIANFSADKTSVVVGNAINFTDQSTNNPTSWSWNFGDGGTSSLQNPSHVYTVAGTYTVSLTSTNSYGSDNESKANYIVVNTNPNAPVADFRTNLNTVFVGGTIIFYNQSTNNPTNLLWDFGDGSSATSNTVMHTYYTPGIYTITLTSTNGFGSDAETKVNLITVKPLNDTEVNFNPNLTYGTIEDIEGNTYKTIQIGNQTWMAENLKTTRLNDNTNISYVTPSQWNTSTSPSYCWPSANPTLKNTFGALYNIYALNDKLCPNGWHVGTLDEWNELISNLGGLSTGGGHAKENLYYHWLEPNAGADNSSGFTAIPSGFVFINGAFGFLGQAATWWTSTGTYYVGTNHNNANIFSDNRLEYYNGFSVRCLRNPLPSAAFDANRTSIYAEESVIFTDRSTNNPTSWSWNFGDGGTSTQQNPSHIYRSIGVFTVSLTVSNLNGTDSETKVGYITVRPPAPVANFTVNNTNIVAGNTVIFTDQSTNNPTNWSWNFGDGYTSTSKNPSHLYNKSGSFTVTLTATNSGGSDSEIKYNYITVTLAPWTVADIAGNIYHYITIGSQTWMVENLKVKKYKDGSIITDANNPSIWSSLGINGGYCRYNTETNESTYGLLYNYQAIRSQMVCPTGWHVSTATDWNILLSYIGYANAGTALKEEGSTHWPVGSAGTDLYGFKALPGGYRDYAGIFYQLQYRGYWWTPDLNGGVVPQPYVFFMGDTFNTVNHEAMDSRSGRSVRCVKD